MAYRIVIVRKAEKDLEKLDPVVKKRIKTSLVKFSRNPLLYAKKLKSSSVGAYRFRMGSHRIIFDIGKNTVVILRIGHRREIYQ